MGGRRQSRLYLQAGYTYRRLTRVTRQIEAKRGTQEVPEKDTGDNPTIAQATR
jgi:hypothetical protein